MRPRHASLVLLLLAAACVAPAEDAVDVSTATDTAPLGCGPIESGAGEVIVTTAWGSGVPGAHWAIQPDGDDWVLSAQADGFQAATIRLRKTTDDHLAATVEAGDAFVAVGRPATGACRAPVLFVGLAHRWFADAGPEPTRNDVRFYLAGEPLFADLYEDLQAVAETVAVTTWWWQSDFELLRPADSHLTLSAQERWPFTVLGILASLTGVHVNVLVNRFAADTASGMAYVNTDTALREHAWNTGDHIEVMLQGNPTPVPVQGPYTPGSHPVPYLTRVLAHHPEYADYEFEQTETLQQALTTVEAASWHQKVWVLDEKVAYVSGMNVKSTDWDTTAHDVFQPRRMKFISPVEDRLAVANHLLLPDVGPRKDAGVRLAGPAAAQVADLLARRWAWGRAQGDLFADLTTPFPRLDRPAPVADGIPAQIVATLPEPLGERSILETQAKAIRNARKLILIEDQYFRAPVLLPAFEEALAASPHLQVVVVTKPVSPMDGAKKWTLYMDEHLRDLAGPRYHLFQLYAFDASGIDGEGPLFQPIDVHTKLMFVDGEYLTVGSANKNNRGLLYEGEMNAAILDAHFVTDAFEAYMDNLTGQPDVDWGATNPTQLAAHLTDLAAANEALRATAKATNTAPEPPTGFLYPLAFTSDYYVDVGPDAF